MKILISIIGVLLFQVSKAQDYETMKNNFLSEVVIGDSINLKTLPKEVIYIDSLELFKHIDYAKHSIIELSYNDTIPKFIDTASVSLRKKLIQQVGINNTFKWKDLNADHFYIYKGKNKSKGGVNYSLPIFYSKNKVLIYYLSYFDSSFAGKSVDFWEYKDGKWIKINSETLWMS